MREVRSYTDSAVVDAATIASEVILGGFSSGWFGELAALEERKRLLATFGIRYADDMRGEWRASMPADMASAGPFYKYLTIVAVVAVPDQVADRDGDDLLRDLGVSLSEWRTHDDVGRFSSPMTWARIDRGLSTDGVDEGTLEDHRDPHSFNMGELRGKGLHRKSAQRKRKS